MTSRGGIYTGLTPRNVQGLTVVGYPTRAGKAQPAARPKADRIRRNPTPVAEYLAGLDELGLTDPTDAAEHHARADALKAEARKPREAPSTARRRITSALASGELTAAKADGLIADLLDDETHERGTANRRAILEDAAAVAYLNAERAVINGEDLIIELLNATALEAIHDQTGDDRPIADAQSRWDIAVRIAYRLRQHELISTNPGATASEYLYARPDLVHQWRLERSKTPRGFVAFPPKRGGID